MKTILYFLVDFITLIIALSLVYAILAGIALYVFGISFGEVLPVVYLVIAGIFSISCSIANQLPNG